MRVKQVHGRVGPVLRAGADGLPAAAARPDADAIVSDEPGAVLAVQVADCVPAADGRSRVAAPLAAVHAGWRGTAARRRRARPSRR